MGIDAKKYPQAAMVERHQGAIDQSREFVDWLLGNGYVIVTEDQALGVPGPMLNHRDLALMFVGVDPAAYTAEADRMLAELRALVYGKAG